MEARDVKPEPLDDVPDWRHHFPADSREKVLRKIIDCLKKHLNLPDGCSDLKKVAEKFEAKTYDHAANQADYLRKISMKLLSMESKSQRTVPVNPQTPNSAVVSQSSTDSASPSFQSQISSQGQSLPIPLVTESSAHQLVFPQNLQTSTSSSSRQGSSCLTSTVCHTSNLQSISGSSQNPLPNSVGEGTYLTTQRQMQGRPQHPLDISHQQHQPLSPFIYQHQIQQHILKQSGQQPSLAQPHLQQQTHLQSSQQPLNQMSSCVHPGKSQVGTMQSSHSSNQQNHLKSIQHCAPSLLQQHPKTSSLQLSPSTASQQSSALQPRQQLLIQQLNMSKLQQTQLAPQQTSLPDVQQKRLPAQQQILNQQGISLHQQQTFSAQNNEMGLHQQQLIGNLMNIPNMLPHHPSTHALQQANITAQLEETQKPSLTMLQSQGHPSQHQSLQQQIKSSLLSQPTKLQHQLMLHTRNSLQQEMQHRFQSAGAVPPSPNAVEQQKVLVQSQKGSQEGASTASMGSTTRSEFLHGSVEEIYQKICSMRELYLKDICEIYRKVVFKLRQPDALTPSQKQQEHNHKMQQYKEFLERAITLMRFTRENIQPHLAEKIPSFEAQIKNIISIARAKRSISQPEGQPLSQHPGGHANLVLQKQPSQASLVQFDNGVNQVQQMNFPGSISSVTPVPASSVVPSSSQSGVPETHQKIMNALSSGSNMDSSHGSSFSSMEPRATGSLQQVALGSIQNSVGAPQLSNTNSLSQSSLNTFQTIASNTQPNLNLVQQQHIKQEQPEQHQLQQTPQMRHHMQQHHMQMQLFQQQQKPHSTQQPPQPQQQMLQQQKQQQMLKFPQHQVPVHQMNECSDLRVRQGCGNKSGVYQQHFPPSQRHSYLQQQLKGGATFPVSSPQNLQASSPQISQHSSSQIDQQNLLSSVPKSGTTLQSANSPFIVPSPSTPLTPTSVPAEPEKQLSGISSLSNAGHNGQSQTALGPAQAHVLSLGTPGISASPLLAECASPDGNLVPSSQTGNSSKAERPIEHLIRVIQSSTPYVFGSSIRDIGSVIDVVDAVASSAPGNGSRAAIGEDLAKMTNFDLQAGVSLSHPRKRTRSGASGTAMFDISITGSTNGSSMQFYSSDASDIESTATSNTRWHNTEFNNSVLEELRQVNKKLIDTVVSASDKDADSIAAESENKGGMVIQFAFRGVSVNPNSNSNRASAQMFPILPVKLLVPSDYPASSPLVLDQMPEELRKESEDLSVKTHEKFNLSLRDAPQPMSIAKMARLWDSAARDVILRYAEEHGGGSFSSTYGAWHNCFGL